MLNLFNVPMVLFALIYWSSVAEAVGMGEMVGLSASVVGVALGKKGKGSGGSDYCVDQCEQSCDPTSQCDICSKYKKIKPEFLTVYYTAFGQGINKQQHLEKHSNKDWCPDGAVYETINAMLVINGIEYRVSQGEYFDITPGNQGKGGKGKGSGSGNPSFGANSYLEYKDATGTMKKCYWAHTSCSQAFSVGDQFGPLVIIGGGILGAEDNCETVVPSPPVPEATSAVPEATSAVPEATSAVVAEPTPTVVEECPAHCVQQACPEPSPMPSVLPEPLPTPTEGEKPCEEEEERC